MDGNKKKLAVLNLILALIVFTLFGLAPQAFNAHHADSGAMQAESDAGLDNGAGPPPDSAQTLASVVP